MIALILLFPYNTSSLGGEYYYEGIEFALTEGYADILQTLMVALAVACVGIGLIVLLGLKKRR